MANKIKKSTVALVAVAIIGTAAAPVATYAKNCPFSFSSLQGALTSLFARADAAQVNDAYALNGIGVFNNTSVQNARRTYNTALQQADKNYNTARNTARTNLNNNLRSAGNDSAKRLSAYKTYMSDMLAAYKQHSSAVETAMQQYMDALSNVQTTNQAPTANSQSVTLSENTSKTIA